MPIRLSGLQSQLDTDAIVRDLVSAYSIKKDNMVKAQTKLTWKQDAWKDMNSKIYNLFSKTLSPMRFSSAYSKKTASIANASVAKVTASAGATSGTQTLVVEKLASSGYLTGGVISGSTEDGKVKGSSKLSEVTGMSGFTNGTISVGVEGKRTTIEMTSDMTVNQFVTQLKSAGINASFDEKNQRFFISSNKSGKDNDFTMLADDLSGLDALKSMGLYTNNSAESAEYAEWAQYHITGSETPEELAEKTAALDAIKESTYESSKTDYDTVAKEYKDKYQAAVKNKESLTASNEALQKEVDALEAQKQNGTLTSEDIGKIDERIQKYQEKIDKNNEDLAKHDQTIEETQDFVPNDTDTAEDLARKQQNIQDEVDGRNAETRAKIEANIDSRVAAAYEISNTVIEGTEGAVRTVGGDSVIYLNGAEFTSSTNNYEINGLTIQAQDINIGSPTTITTDTDVDGIYNMIKDFFTEYNDLMKSMDTAYNAKRAKGYEPLTDEERDSMSDSEVEKWEKTIKDALLSKDATLNSVINSMKANMLKGYEVNGKTYTLSSFGIATSSYFSAADNERGAYHINGNPDDPDTSGNADQLRAAIANDPDSVVQFFSQLAEGVYKDLNNKMTSSSLRSAYNVYNDKQMAEENKDYTKKIKDWEEKIKNMEDSYYRKFTAMEKALAQLNSNTSSLASLMGGK